MLYKGDNTSMRTYSIAMLVLGVGFIVGLPFVATLYPPGFSWHGKADVYRAMLLSMYLGLGIVYLIGARDPLKYSGVVDYTIVSSIVHALVMAYYAFKYEDELAHMWGDVPFLLIIAIVLIFYHPRKIASRNAATESAQPD